MRKLFPLYPHPSPSCFPIKEDELMAEMETHQDQEEPTSSP